MKYDLSKPITRGAKRTLDALNGAMFLLLSEKSFEELTVGELCEQAQYPRATFYNYFDDKYDLLNYCWLSLAEKIGLSNTIMHRKMRCCIFSLTESTPLQNRTTN